MIQGLLSRQPNTQIQKKIEMSQPAISALVNAAAHIEGAVLLLISWLLNSSSSTAAAHIEGAVLLLEFSNQEMSGESASQDEIIGAFMLLELSRPKSPTTVVTRDLK